MSKVFEEHINAIRITGFYAGKNEVASFLGGGRICINELMIPFSSEQRDGVDIGIKEQDLLEVVILRCNQRLDEIAQNRFRGNYGALPENVEMVERELNLLKMRLKGCQLSFDQIQ